VARCYWLTPVTLATWEPEIRKIAVPRQPGKKILRDLISTEKKLRMDGGVPLSSQQWWEA
jgi:hypothetical protein